MKKFLFAVVVIIACTSNERARKTLEGAGYTHIEMTGYDAFTCADSDDTCSGFEARGPNGHTVRGAVGCGMGCGKGCTIRFK